MANLVIVESPAKANTIKSYLGSSYKVIASKGHIRDLPRSSLGIDIENGFEPHYINIRGKGDLIKELKKEAKNSSRIYLATDPDREGEAISWHIANELDIDEDKVFRVTFNEITKTAVREAIKNPTHINMDLVYSQQARRILDRLVGFKLSQVLWKKVGSGLSGGRVQSVATRIISEREQEIRSFIPKEYWKIDACLVSDSGEQIRCRFYGDQNGKIRLENEESVAFVLSRIDNSSFTVKTVKHAEKVKSPAPPFTTSTLQQEASKRIGFQSHKTMKIAQELYDGLYLGSELGGTQGLITYMRTDSTRISTYAQESAREFIKQNYGDEYIPVEYRVFKTKNDVQDAHEAIRPSDISLTPNKLKKILSQDQYKLYRLIWERFLASQMQSAIIDTVSVDIENNGYIFKTAGNLVKSQGFMVLYDFENEESADELDEVSCDSIPKVEENQRLNINSLNSSQHFTEPPPRFTEATLIKFMEDNGIGRPSTYAPIISIIISRDYVRRDGKSLVATKLGEITTQFMKENFPEVVDYEFTAYMETRLDSIAQRENSINRVIEDFYDKFAVELEKVEKAEGGIDAGKIQQVSEFKCPLCSKPMIYKTGRFGKFLACVDYPQCKSTLTVDKDGNPIRPKKNNGEEIAAFKCNVCNSNMVLRTGRYGEFYACVNYPKCRYTKQKTEKTGVSCPKCGRQVVARNSGEKSIFYSCEGYPECDFSSWDKPMNEKCPQCGNVLFYKRLINSVVCKSRDCNYKLKRDSDKND